MGYNGKIKCLAIPQDVPYKQGLKVGNIYEFNFVLGI